MAGFLENSLEIFVFFAIKYKTLPDIMSKKQLNILGKASKLLDNNRIHMIFHFKLDYI